MNTPKVFCIADHILSPLADGSIENYSAAKKGITGIRLIQDQKFHPVQTHCARFDRDTAFTTFPPFAEEMTLLENLMVYSIRKCLAQITDIDINRTGFFIATTKGNISILEQAEPNAPFNQERVNLGALANVVSEHLGFRKNPIVVSNACISGVSAILTAKRFIEIGEIDHAIVCGGDLISSFIVSGFHAFMAISDEPCKPYDKHRKGITLGEGIATMVLSKLERVNPNFDKKIVVAGGGNSNDANHISGPSRTGEGLVNSIQSSLNQANLKSNEIDFISAHGTATPYNDEMEAIAFNRMQMSGIPLNSLKGYFGHTLGAAGIVESIMGLHQLANKSALPTLGLEAIGVSELVNASGESIALDGSRHLMKTISGFGGFNASVIFEMKSE